MTAEVATEPWIATTATVTTCKFQFAGLSSMAFGVNLSQKFRITFDYYAHGRLYSDDFQSPTAIPQNTQIPISYNPLAPAENSRTHRSFALAGYPRKPPLVLLGIAGSLVLSLAWLAILHGCN
jgi:hypothetical protein